MWEWSPPQRTTPNEVGGGNLIFFPAKLHLTTPRVLMQIVFSLASTFYREPPQLLDNETTEKKDFGGAIYMPYNS